MEASATWTTEEEEQARLEAERDADLQSESKTIAELAAEGGDDGEEGEQLALLDFGDTVSLTIRGKKPTDSEIKIKSISRPIKGQLGDKMADDETITLVVTARLDDMHFPAKRNGDGQVISRTRRHVLTPISMNLITAEQADSLLGMEG